jgi:hypothetical protein
MAASKIRNFFFRLSVTALVIYVILLISGIHRTSLIMLIMLACPHIMWMYAPLRMFQRYMVHLSSVLTLNMEEPFTSKMLATLPTSTQFKDPKPESTFSQFTPHMVMCIMSQMIIMYLNNLFLPPVGSLFTWLVIPFCDLCDYEWNKEGYYRK